MDPRVEKILPWAVGVGGVAVGVGLYLYARPGGLLSRPAPDPDPNRGGLALSPRSLPIFLDTHESFKLGREFDWERLRGLERDKRIVNAMARKGYVWSEDPSKFNNAPLGDALAEGDVAGRIATLYQKVDDFQGKSSPMMRPLIETSEKAFYNAATDLQLKLKDKTQWEGLAKQLGVPIATVKNGEAQLVKLFKSAGVDISSVLGALNGAAGDLVLAFVRKGADIVAAEISSGIKALGDMADFAGAIPLIGQMIKVAIDLYVSYQTSVDADWQQFAQQYMQYVYKKDVLPLTERFMPLLWNAEAAWDLSPPARGSITRAPKYMETADREQWAKTLWRWREAVVPATTDNEKMMVKHGHESYGLPIELTANIRKWWAGAAGVAGDGRIAQIFSALERDREIIMTPNDEMVLPITSVVSLLEGYEPVEFAKFVWGFTPGWRRESELAGDRFVWTDIKDVGRVTEDSPLAPRFAEYTNMRRKAYNMASMARCAYDLVDVLASKEVQDMTGPMKVRPFTRLDTPVVAHGLEGISAMREAVRQFTPGVVRTSGTGVGGYVDLGLEAITAGFR